MTGSRDQGVERERILVGRGLPLLDERAEHAALVRVERADCAGGLRNVLGREVGHETPIKA
jgi:hypothetical protein